MGLDDHESFDRSVRQLEPQFVTQEPPDRLGRIHRTLRRSGREIEVGHTDVAA